MSKSKKVSRGSRTIAAAQETPDNFPALLALSHAIFSDYVNGETTKETRIAVSEALRDTILPTLELGIRLKVASGLSVRDFLHQEESKLVEQTLDETLSQQLVASLAGETKMNVPATKLLLSHVAQKEQIKQDTYAAAVLTDEKVQAAIAEKLHKLKQEEMQNESSDATQG